jgi:N-acetylglutamate synthase-like GNAT family acetyltransferase
MHVRTAKPDDMGSIYMMGFDVWGDDMSPDEYLKCCRESQKYQKGQWKVLEQDGQLLSSLILYQLKNEWIGVGSIATPEQLRCRKYAANLIMSVLDELRRSPDLNSVFLFSDIAPHYYHKFGFTKLPERFQNEPGSVCMGLSLNDSPSWLESDFVPPFYF